MCSQWEDKLLFFDDGGITDCSAEGDEGEEDNTDETADWETDYKSDTLNRLTFSSSFVTQVLSSTVPSLSSLSSQSITLTRAGRVNQFHYFSCYHAVSLLSLPHSFLL